MSQAKFHPLEMVIDSKGLIGEVQITFEREEIHGRNVNSCIILKADGEEMERWEKDLSYYNPYDKKVV